MNAPLRQTSSAPTRDDILRTYLREVRDRLDLSFDQLGRLFRVSGETVRRWESGAIRVPDAHGATLAGLIQNTRRLAKIFDPVRLPMVIRRPAPLFQNAMAIDWILDGRLEEVADLYEAALLYQA